MSAPDSSSTPLPSRSPSPKTLGATTLAAIIVGVAISQVALVGILQSIGMASHTSLWLLGLAFFCAYLLALSYAATFSELSLMMPSSGGISTYTEVAIGNFPAMVATYSGYVVVNFFGVPAELMLFDSVAREVGGIPLPPKVLALSLLALLTYLNVRGTDVFAALQNSTSMLKVGLVLALAIASYFIAGPLPATVVDIATTPTASSNLPVSFGLIVGLFFWCFVGAEFVCPMINEIKQPQRVIPRSMFLGISALALLFALFGLGARRLLPEAVLTGSSFPHLDYAIAVFGRVGSLVLLLMAATATISLVNAILAGISRLVYGMALNGQAFSILGREHPRYRSPWIAIVGMALTFSIPILLMGNHPDTITTLVVAASTSWLVAYIIGHVNLIVLRRRYPKSARPFRSPWFPLPQLFGIGGMIYLIASNPDEVNQLAGYVLGAVAILSALWTRFVMKRGLFAPEPLPPVLNTVDEAQT